MGTKQLLLIVLGVIVVTVAVYSGMQIYDAQYTENIRQELINRVSLISNDAFVYYNRPKDQGGGGYSFKGYKPNEKLTEKTETIRRININYRERRDQIVLTIRGRVTGTDGKRPIIIRGLIDKEGLVLQTRN
ncbi:MAG: hypothetical protein JW995_12455 [Melioribacteraceae bacterium]|nr:hypothetical protein [Melioribacteraceae bacterium]